MTPPSTWTELRQFQVRSDDIFVIAYPKSGSHWLMDIINLLQNNAENDHINPSYLDTTLELRKDNLQTTQGTSLPGYQTIPTWKSPRIILTHCFAEFLPPQVWEKHPKVIYLARNPKDVAVSIYHYISQLLPSFLHGWGTFIDYFLSSDFFGGSWFKHVLGYLPHMKRPNFLLVKYEDLYKDLKGVISEVNDHLDCPFPPGGVDLVVQESAFAKMRQSNEEADKDAEKKIKGNRKLSKVFGGSQISRKNIVGEWREFLNNGISEKFDNIYKARMRSSGLTQDFEL
ncbi:sulfotransferase 1C2-like isoform X2 [Amphiura filiformis]